MKHAHMKTRMISHALLCAYYALKIFQLLSKIEQMSQAAMKSSYLKKNAKKCNSCKIEIPNMRRKIKMNEKTKKQVTK